MNTSIKMEVPCEFINVVPVNPLISKCQIKVCYVGEQPNRNKSVITKEVATQMANSLPGSPIVGFYNEETGDFEEHNRELYFEDGQIKLKDTTRPYGFVDLGAKCWFQKFLDNGVEHEYLMTEGYLWTGQYPETQRIIEKGDNHSMELDEKLTKATWATLDNKKGKFFIINEAVISKLCILGEKYEPCFEGSAIEKFKFSFSESFSQQIFSMMKEITEYINKGGETMPKNEIVSAVTEEDVLDPEFKKKTDEEEDKENKTPTGNQDKDTDEAKTDDTEANGENAKADETKAKDAEGDDDDEEKKKKKKYSLEEIPEYVELSAQFTALKEEKATLDTQIASLQEQINALTEFKNQVDKKDKEAMIESFYMLSDEDKKDCVDHINEYSLDEIESRLSVICFRNKVSFDLDKEEKKEEDSSFTYNLSDDETDDSIPAWVKAVIETSKNHN